jgi:hypothetical protein
MPHNEGRQRRRNEGSLENMPRAELNVASFRVAGLERWEALETVNWFVGQALRGAPDERPAAIRAFTSMWTSLLIQPDNSSARSGLRPPYPFMDRQAGDPAG